MTEITPLSDESNIYQTLEIVEGYKNGYFGGHSKFCKEQDVKLAVQQLKENIESRLAHLFVDRNKKYLDEYEKGHLDGWDDCIEEIDSFDEEIKEAFGELAK